MNTALILVFFSVCLFSLATANTQLWAEFKQKYHKSYASPQEEEERFAIFSENLKKLEKIRALNTNGATFGITNVMDRHVSELMGVHDSNSFLSAKRGINSKRSSADILDITTYGYPAVSFDDSIDYTANMTNITNQLSCGSCWAFASTAVAEYAYLRAAGNKIKFSEKNLVDCCASCCKTKCNCLSGGFEFYALQYYVDNGFVLDTEYPYNITHFDNVSDSCPFTFPRSNKMKGYSYLGAEGYTENLLGVMETYLKYFGPITATVDGGSDAFQLYTGGIITLSQMKANLCAERVSHGISIVGLGYNSTTKMKYWIGRNSWGTGWGDNGYFYIERGSNVCGIENRVAGIIFDDCESRTTEGQCSGNQFCTFYKGSCLLNAPDILNPPTRTTSESNVFLVGLIMALIVIAIVAVVVLYNFNKKRSASKRTEVTLGPGPTNGEL